MNVNDENTRKIWAKERQAHDLKYPDDAAVRLIHHWAVPRGGGNALDFGCGTGRNALMLTELGFNVTAMDYNDYCIDKTREKMEAAGFKATYIKNNGTDVPCPPQSQDLILAWGSLFCFCRKERNELLHSLKEALKPTGVLIADYRGKDDSMYGKGKEIEPNVFILDERVKSTHVGATYLFVDEKDLRQIMAENGFEVANLEKRLIYTDNMSQCVAHYYVVAKGN